LFKTKSSHNVQYLPQHALSTCPLFPPEGIQAKLHQTPGLIDTGLYSRRRSRSKNKPDHSPKSRQPNSQNKAQNP